MVKGNKAFEKGQFNTLGQVKNWELLNTNENRGTGINGTGAELEYNKLGNWAKRKTISRTILLELISVAEKKNRPLAYIKQLWNSYHCLNSVLTNEYKLFGRYCKKKVCLVCNGIKKAELIRKYFPYLKQWEQPYFITLTVKSIPANKLENYIRNGMTRGIQRIINRHYKNHQLNKGSKLIGLRALECNFNPKKRTYNPHFHLIVQNKEMADLFVSEWIKLWKGKAGKQSQFIRPVLDTEKDLIEVIKYSTKIFTDPSMQKKKTSKTNYNIYVSAIENILFALRNKRQYEHFGFKLTKEIEIKSKTQINSELKQWKFNPEKSDWVSSKNENEQLTNFQIDLKLQSILENNLDTTIE
jgi:hypothetical protein